MTSIALVTVLRAAGRAGVAVCLWGDPGIGKSALIQAAAEADGVPCETVIGSLREPSDFAGLPVVTDDGVRLEPPAWAKRLQAAQAGYSSWTNCRPRRQLSSPPCWEWLSSAGWGTCFLISGQFFRKVMSRSFTGMGAGSAQWVSAIQLIGAAHAPTPTVSTPVSALGSVCPSRWRLVQATLGAAGDGCAVGAPHGVAACGGAIAASDTRGTGRLDRTSLAPHPGARRLEYLADF